MDSAVASTEQFVSGDITLGFGCASFRSLCSHSSSSAVSVHLIRVSSVKGLPCSTNHIVSCCFCILAVVSGLCVAPSYASMHPVLCVLCHFYHHSTATPVGTFATPSPQGKVVCSSGVATWGFSMNGNAGRGAYTQPLTWIPGPHKDAITIMLVVVVSTTTAHRMEKQVSLVPGSLVHSCLF